MLELFYYNELFLTIKMYTMRTSGVNKQRGGKGTRIM